MRSDPPAFLFVYKALRGRGGKRGDPSCVVLKELDVWDGRLEWRSAGWMDHDRCSTVRALVSRGHEVVCLVRRSTVIAIPINSVEPLRVPAGATQRIVDLTDPLSLPRDGIRGESFDVLMSCLASRTGLPEDAWAIDYGAHVSALHASRAAGVTHVVLLSAICVQKPILAFQRAKLAFEAVLIASGLDYTIVRPTAFFKSLSGQIERVKRGKPFLVFGDGTLTACKPISDDDLGRFLADCLDDGERRNRILPIGGPGVAITPRAQGEALFALLGREPRFTHVPVMLLDVIITVLAMIGRWMPALAAKAELARIGRYYVTESMLVLAETRSIQPYGVILDGVHYDDEDLNRWIGVKSAKSVEAPRQFTFRCDPRDISQIWFFEPDLGWYFPIPYRNVARPAVSLWEMRTAKAEILKEGKNTGRRKDIVRRHRARQREIVEDARHKTKSARPEHHRATRHLPASTDTPPVVEMVPRPSQKQLPSAEDLFAEPAPVFGVRANKMGR